MNVLTTERFGAICACHCDDRGARRTCHVTVRGMQPHHCMNDEQQAPVVSSNQHRLGAIVRKHPLLSMLGVGGIALIGGTELAAGVLIGAGIDTMLRRRRTAKTATETHESQEAAE